MMRPDAETIASTTAVEADSLRYRLHGLVDVHVDPATDASIRSGIDFQVGPYRTDATLPPAARTLAVGPYHGPPGPGAAYSDFHGVRYRFGESAFLPDERLGFSRTEDGLAIHADRPVIVINPFLQALFVETGTSMVHAAAVIDPSGDATLLPGAGGVGKTAVVGSLVMDSGHRFLGDDVVLLHERGTVLSFHRKMVLKPGHETVYARPLNGGVRPRSASRLGRHLAVFAKENVPFRGVIRSMLDRTGGRDRIAKWTEAPPEHVAVAPAEVFGSGMMGSEGRLVKTVFLERHRGGSLEAAPLDHDGLVARIFSIMWHEWEGYMRPWFMLGATGISDPASVFARMRAILAAATAGTRPYLVKIPDGAAPDRVGKLVCELD